MHATCLAVLAAVVLALNTAGCHLQASSVINSFLPFTSLIRFAPGFAFASLSALLPFVAHLRALAGLQSLHPLTAILHLPQPNVRLRACTSGTASAASAWGGASGGGGSGGGAESSWLTAFALFCSLAKAACQRTSFADCLSTEDSKGPWLRFKNSLASLSAYCRIHRPQEKPSVWRCLLVLAGSCASATIIDKAA